MICACSEWALWLSQKVYNMKICNDLAPSLSTSQLPFISMEILKLLASVVNSLSESRPTSSQTAVVSPYWRSLESSQSRPKWGS